MTYCITKYAKSNPFLTALFLPYPIIFLHHYVAPIAGFWGVARERQETTVKSYVIHCIQDRTESIQPAIRGFPTSSLFGWPDIMSTHPLAFFQTGTRDVVNFQPHYQHFFLY